MSDASSSAILLIIGIIVTCAVISFAFVLHSGFSDASSKAANSQVSQNASMEDATYTKYTEKNLNGSDVIRALKMLYGNDNNFTIQIDSKDIVPAGMKVEDFQKKYEEERKTIVQNDPYHAELIYSENGSLVGINFISGKFVDDKG